MSLSNEGFGLGIWEPYQREITDWPLEPGDGVKTIYAEYRDWSDPPHLVQASDTIVLDESPPVLGASGIIFLHTGTDALEVVVSPYDLESYISGTEYAVSLSEVPPSDPAAWTSTDGHVFYYGDLQEGETYFFHARATNGSGLETVASASFTVAVIGRAIIVAGGGDAFPNPILGQTRLLADYAYMVMMTRGFGGEDPATDKVYYLAPYGLENPWVDGDATTANLQDAIETWAAAAVNENVPLFLYLADHGGPDKFLLNQVNQDPEHPDNVEFITTEELDGWLDTLQAATGCTVVVIYEACRSGSFIDATDSSGQTLDQTLSDPDRVIITSAAYDEPASFLQDGAVSFSHFFFEDAGIGKNLLQCFNRSVETIAQYEDFNQTPQLDDNGDAVYIEFDDGPLAETLYLGLSPLAPSIEIVDTSISRHISPGLAITLWADVESLNVVDEVIAHIVPPPGSATLAWDEFMSEDSITSGRYELSAYTGFVEEGSYTVEIRAEDVNGNTAVPRQVIITVSTGAYPEDPFEVDNSLDTARRIADNVEIQLHSFHVDEDEDWVEFFGASDMIYDIRTYNPAGEDCDYPQVDTYMELYDAQGTLLASNDDPAAGCTGGPAAIVDHLIANNGYYYVRITHASNASGPGTEYQFRVLHDQGDTGRVRAEVKLNGNPVAGASVRFESGNLQFIGVPEGGGWYRNDNISVDEDGSRNYKAHASYSSYSGESGIQTVTTSGPTLFEVNLSASGGPPPPPACRTAGGTASPRDIYLAREDTSGLLLYLIPALVIAVLWRRSQVTPAQRILDN